MSTRIAVTIGTLFGGILLTAVFSVLRLVGVIDWAPIWIMLPLIVDIVLWIGTARSLIVMDHILAKAMAKAGMPFSKDPLAVRVEDQMPAEPTAKGETP